MKNIFSNYHVMELKLIFFLFLTSLNLNAQTKSYKMILGGTLLYERINLNEDGTYERISEYDLSFTMNGNYKIIDDTLILTDLTSYEFLKKKNPDLQINTSSSDSLKIKNENLFFIKNGKVVKRIKDKSLKKGFSNIFGHKYEYKLIKQ